MWIFSWSVVKKSFCWLSLVEDPKLGVAALFFVETICAAIEEGIL